MPRASPWGGPDVETGALTARQAGVMQKQRRTPIDQCRARVPGNLILRGFQQRRCLAAVYPRGAVVAEECRREAHQLESSPALAERRQQTLQSTRMAFRTAGDRRFRPHPQNSTRPFTPRQAARDPLLVVITPAVEPRPAG